MTQAQLAELSRILYSLKLGDTKWQVKSGNLNTRSCLGE